MEFGSRIRWGLVWVGNLCRRKILPSIAHTDAIYEETIKAIQVGFRHITHLYSGMSTIIRRNAFRYAGVLEAAYMLDDMTVEIIADGVHLPKSLLQYVYKFKGPERLHLLQILCGEQECQMDLRF